MIIKTFVATASNFDEQEILQKFHHGITNAAVDNEVVLDIDNRYSRCDVGIILGSWKPKDKDWHIIRNSIANESRCFIVIETALLGRKVHESNTHHRIGVNGFLNNSGKFTANNCDSSRFDQLGISWNGWRNNHNGDIVLMMQLPGDASLRGINSYNWALHAIKQIREVTDRPIKIRTHPAFNPKDGDEFHQFVFNTAMSGASNISFSDGKLHPLSRDLDGAYCTVAYSSGSSIDSILAGIPTVACDPGNFAYELSTNFLEQINALRFAEPHQVMQWLYNLAYSQWTVDEMYNGTAWRHLLPIIEQVHENLPKKKSK